MQLSIVTTLYQSSRHINAFYDRISKEAQKITDEYAFGRPSVVFLG